MGEWWEEEEEGWSACKLRKCSEKPIRRGKSLWEENIRIIHSANKTFSINNQHFYFQQE